MQPVFTWRKTPTSKLERHSMHFFKSTCETHGKTIHTFPCISGTLLSLFHRTRVLEYEEAVDMKAPASSDFLPKFETIMISCNHNRFDCVHDRIRHHDHAQVHIRRNRGVPESVYH